MFPDNSQTQRRFAQRVRAVSLLLLACTSLLSAQVSVGQSVADSLFERERWGDAAAAYASISKAEPNNGAVWTNLGECLLQLHRFDEAIVAFSKAEALKFRPFVNVINQARAYAEKSDTGKVITLLQRVVDGGAGGALRPRILGSPEFKRLRGTREWKSLVVQMKPCTAAPYRQFDFWIGDWDVLGPAGDRAGRNRVTLEQEGCLLVEHWTSEGDLQTGTSFNYYDIRDKKWHQLYLDNSGNAGAFPAMAGSFEDGKMVLLTEDTDNTLSRWTWFVMAPGRVKQMAEVSNDHGATWRITWNSVYVARNAKKSD